MSTSLQPLPISLTVDSPSLLPYKEEGLPNLGFEVTRLNTYTAVPVHHVDQIVLTQALSAPVVTVASPSAVRLHFHGGNQICTKIIILFFLFSLELFLCVSPYLLKLIASRWRLQEWTDGVYHSGRCYL
ncbi:unnamed protein product [Camellia sinensis]